MAKYASGRIRKTLSRMSGKSNFVTSDHVDYQVPRWRLILRLTLVLILVGLNYALIGSTLELHQLGSVARTDTTVFSLLVLLFFDLTLLVPSLLQASAVSVGPKGIILKTMLWKSQLNWVDILWFSKPASLSFALIRSKRCLYFLARSDFANFDELVRIIASHASQNPAVPKLKPKS